MTLARRWPITVDVSAVAPTGCHLVAATIVAPPVGVAVRPEVLCCLPGGGMSARYFDLSVPGADATYSMAEHLAGAGFVSVLLDHPGVGSSDVPDDGYTLSPAVVADVDTAAIDDVIGRLRAGSRVDGLDPIPALAPIGVGHSMGGMIVAVQQARHRAYAAVVLLGHAGRGLPEALGPAETTIANDRDAIDAQLAALTEARFGRPFPRSSTSTSDYLLGGPVDDVLRDDLRSAASSLIGVCGLASMIPGSHERELGAIDVPVFCGVGDADITGPPHEIPAHLSASGDVTLFVLRGAGHNSNVAPTRARLWDRLAAWITALGSASE